MKRAFVAGATSPTGQELVRFLVENGIETFAHIRPDSRNHSKWHKLFLEMGAMMTSTPWDYKPMCRAMARLHPDIIFTLLEAREQNNSSSSYVDNGQNSLLLKATVRAKIQPRFVYLASNRAEQSAATGYLQARWKMESELKRSGLPFTIARQTLLALNDQSKIHALEKMGAAMSDGITQVASFLGGRKETKLHPQSEKGIALALIRLAFSSKAENRIFHSEELQQLSHHLA